MYTVYKHTCISTGKSYIGYTNGSMEERLRSHHQAALRGSPFVFHKALIKYGIDNWSSEVLDTCETFDEAEAMEIHFIANYNTLNEGYNMTSGGGGMQNMKRTDEHRRKISESLTGRNLSEDVKDKLRQYSGEKASFYGKKHSAETRAKMSEWQKNNHPMRGRSGDKSPRAVQYLVTRPDGVQELVHGITKYCREHDLSHSVMVHVARGRGDTHRGYICEYVDEELKLEAEQTRKLRHEKRSSSWKAGAAKGLRTKRLKKT